VGRRRAPVRRSLSRKPLLSIWSRIPKRCGVRGPEG
jgi:hypothetical protein